MKKIFIILLSAVLIFSSSAVFADTFDVTVDSKTAKIGETVDINISFKNNSGIIAALFTAEYDREHLELVNVRDGLLLEGGTFSPDCNAYPYKMVWNSASTENFDKDGILATLTFKVLQSAKPGKAYINLSCNENDIFDVELNNVPITLINGGVEIPENSSNVKNPTSGNHSTGGISSMPTTNIKDNYTETAEPTPPDSKIEFADVRADAWFAENVKYVTENGLMSGVSEKEFAPNDNLTRAMLVAILYRAEGEPTVNKSIPFADVTANSYYANAVILAQQNGIVSGINETEFAPDENITREQIAVILYRYAKFKGYDVSVEEAANILSYTDFNEISEYAIEAMQYAVDSGLMKGKTEITLNPTDNATRAETAAILQRFIEGNK